MLTAFTEVLVLKEEVAAPLDALPWPDFKRVAVICAHNRVREVSLTEAPKLLRLSFCALNTRRLNGTHVAVLDIRQTLAVTALAGES